MPSYREKLTHWDALSVHLKLLLAEMPFLEKEQARFDALVSEVRSLAVRQQNEEAALRETIRQRQELEKQAHQLGKTLVSVARCKVDPSGRRMASLGITPRKTRRAEANAGSAEGSATPGSLTAIPPRPAT